MFVKVVFIAGRNYIALNHLVAEILVFKFWCGKSHTSNSIKAYVAARCLPDCVCVYGCEISQMKLVIY
jgi:hypothetical protein